MFQAGPIASHAQSMIRAKEWDLRLANDVFKIDYVPLWK